VVHILGDYPERAMQIPITVAKAHLTELVRRAEAGDEVVLTRHGRAAVRLVPVVPAVPRDRGGR
jgi:prevent-host-death family protein